jgi:hypothetical protein
VVDGEPVGHRQCGRSLADAADPAAVQQNGAATTA